MVDLLNLAPEAARVALTQWLDEHGEPAYRAKQILPRLWERPVGSWDDATELPAALRRGLAPPVSPRRLALSTRQGSPDGTQKDLWGLGGGGAGGAGLLPRGERRTPFLSSPGRCALGF